MNSPARLPTQSPPVTRLPAPAGARAGRGLDVAETKCSGLRGLAQQMCYALLYGART
jgi:hypothetical protein